MAEETTTTVEWGDASVEHAAPVRRWSPVRLGASQLSRVGIGSAVIAFALVLAAQVLPWLTVAQSAAPGLRGQNAIDVVRDFTVDELRASHLVLVYGLGLFALFGLAGVVLFAPGRWRAVSAAGIGVAAAQLTILTSIAHAATRGYSASDALPAPEQGFDYSFGPGLYCAFASTALIVVSLVVAGGLVRPRRRSDEATELVEDSPDAPPVDLTVTPLGSYPDPIG